jgi:hypothetical protein
VRVAPTILLLECVIAECPKIARTGHYNCALAAKLSVHELADIYVVVRARRRAHFEMLTSVSPFDIIRQDLLGTTAFGNSASNVEGPLLARLGTSGSTFSTQSHQKNHQSFAIRLAASAL